MTSPISNLKHRAGKWLIDFAVARLLRKDVAALFREQLRLGKAAIIQQQTVKVQLREDLRNMPTAAPEADAGEPRAGHAEAPRGSRSATGAFVDYWSDVYARPYYPDPNELPEGV